MMRTKFLLEQILLLLTEFTDKLVFIINGIIIIIHGGDHGGGVQRWLPAAQCQRRHRPRRSRVHLGRGLRVLICVIRKYW